MISLLLPGAAAAGLGASGAQASPLPPALAVPSAEHLGTAAIAVAVGQTFGGDSYGVNPTAVEEDVNSGDGALELAHKDLAVAGIGVPFELTRQYNSLGASSTGAFGRGWSSLLDLGVSFSQGGSQATVHAEDGQQVGFTWQPASRSWQGGPGVRASLTCSGPATNDVPPVSCTVTRFSDGVNWTLSHGRVQDYLTAAGQGLHFRYSASRISAIVVETTAATALVVSLSRDSHGRVTEVSTPTRHASYQYDSGGDLTTFTDPAGRVWRMTYDIAHRLIAMASFPSASSSQAASTVVASYNATTGRVASCASQDAASRFNATYSWSPDAGDPTSGTASRNDLLLADGLVGHRFGSSDYYSHGVLVGRADANGDATDLSWNSALDLVQTVNPFGATTTMTYDGSGDETSAATELTWGQFATTTMKYDSAHRLVATTDGDGLMTRFTYTGGGELASETKPGGMTTTFAYGHDGLLSQETDPLGNVTTYQRDAAGNVVNLSITTKSGKRPMGDGPVFAYNEAGDETQSLPAVGNLGSKGVVAADRTTYSYDADGELLRTTAPGGVVTSATYDAAGNVSSETNAAGATTTYRFSPASSSSQPGAEKEVITTAAGTTTNVLDANGDLLSSAPPADTSAHAAASATIYTYDPAGQVASETDPRGNLTTFTRDALGDVLTTSSMDVKRIDTYNLVGWPTSSTTDTVMYPPDNGKLGQPQTNSTSTRQQYDNDGNVVEATDATGGVTRYVWVNGHLADVVTGAAADPNAGPGDGHVRVTAYGFDAAGNITSVTTPGGLVTYYGYDALGHVTSKRVGTSTWTATYDSDGNLASTRDPDGRTAKFGFDLAGLETSVSYGWAGGTSGLTAPAVRWTYNAAGERTEMVDGSGAHHYSYDSQGRLTSVQTVPASGGTTQTFSYSYAKAAQVQTTYPDKTAVTTTMDDGGNLMSVSVPKLADGTPAFEMANMLPVDGTTSQSSAGSVLSSSQAAMPSATALNSDPATLPPTGTAYSDGTLGYVFNTPFKGSTGAGTSQDQASGLAAGTAYYDNSSQSHSGNPTYFDLTITDPNGYVLEQRIAPASSKQLFGYNGGTAGNPVAPPIDTLGTQATSGVQLTSMEDAFGQLATYAYGSDGTMSTNSVTALLYGTVSVSSSFAYNALDQVTSEGGSLVNQSVPWSYDKAGQATSIFSVLTHYSIDQGGLQWKLSYNAAGQMAKATCASQNFTMSYGYDGDGNLVSETGTSPSSHLSVALQYDVRPSTPQLALATITDGGTTTHQRYLWGNGPLAVEENGTYYTFHDDNRGTPIEVVGANSSVAETLQYDPYGNLVIPAGGGQIQSRVDTLSAPILVGLDASYRDPVTGLDDFGARWYDPVADQYLSPSPVLAPPSGTPIGSPYEFAGDDPMDVVDHGGVHGGSLSSATSFLGTPGAGSLDQNGAAPVGNGPPATPRPALTPGSGAAAPTSTAPPVFSQQLQVVLASAWGQARAYVTAPKNITQQTISLAKKAYTWLQGSEQQPGAVNAEVGVEERTVGAGAADGVNASEGGTLEGALGEDTATALQDGGADLFSAAGFGAGVGFQISETAKTCAEYGSESEECVASAITVTVSTVAFVACEALTGGTGSAFCSGLQSLLNLVLPAVTQYLAPTFSLLAQTATAAGDFLLAGLTSGSLLSDTVNSFAAAFHLDFLGSVVSSWFSFFQRPPGATSVPGSALLPMFDGYGSSLCDISPALSCLFQPPG